MTAVHSTCRTCRLEGCKGTLMPVHIQRSGMECLLSRWQDTSILPQKLPNMTLHCMDVRCNPGLLVDCTEFHHPCLGHGFKLENGTVI